jgi:hypothetical protein
MVDPNTVTIDQILEQLKERYPWALISRHVYGGGTLRREISSKLLKIMISCRFS